MSWTVITGGQTGVDTGALMAARDCGVEWRAVFPQGYRREKPAPEWMLKQAYELGKYGYDERTRYCVRYAAAGKGRLLVVGGEMQTPGTRLTQQLADHYGLAALDVDNWDVSGTGTLMVAGPRGSSWADGAACAYRIVKALFA